MSKALVPKQGQLSRGKSAFAIAIALVSGVWAGRFATMHDDRKPVQSVALVPEQAGAAAEGPKRYRIPVTDSQPSVGPADALVTIIEWCDLPSADCRAVEPALQAALARHKDELRLIFRHYPQERADSALAHQFLRAAHELGGKFWPARALLLEHQGELKRSDLERYSNTLGLDWKAIAAGLDDHTFIHHVTADRLFADMFDVERVPALFFNGRPLDGPQTEQNIERLFGEELARAKQLVAHGVAKGDVYAELTKNGAWKKLDLRAKH